MRQVAGANIFFAKKICNIFTRHHEQGRAGRAAGGEVSRRVELQCRGERHAQAVVRCVIRRERPLGI